MAKSPAPCGITLLRNAWRTVNRTHARELDQSHANIGFISTILPYVLLYDRSSNQYMHSGGGYGIWTVAQLQDILQSIQV